MAETSKRGWPWKKKSHDKIASTTTTESIESSPRASPHNSKSFDEQDVSKILSDHARVSDEALIQWQHSESKVKRLSDELNAAQTELTSKDILVKQHAKVAEEAVTGWEKAEAEAAAMKQQLDVTIQQKLATEDRVSHLDGALKECMRQLRHVREEQEVRVHESIVKKTREYDKLRQDMEVKLAEAGQRLRDTCSEVLRTRAEVCALSDALQERTNALTEVVDAKACADTEAQTLQVQLQSSEKENSSLKYELRVLSEEVEIRNAERDYERKVSENAGKNQLENVKKIAKLEAECQKLRILVRKKLPGPAALAQMKIEVDALGGTSNGFDMQRRRSSLGRSGSSSPRAALNSPMDSNHNSFYDSYGREEAGVLSERLAGMDDELKMVKEALAKRDGELQVSRLMCAKTASKLSHVEEELEAALQRRERKSSDSCSTSQKGEARKRDELLLLDPWDGGELAEFKKGSDKGLAVGKVDLMDDFAEMERLAMATEKGEVDLKGADVNAVPLFEKKLAAKQRELEEANQMAKEVSKQLTHAEEQLTILQSRNRANESALVAAQEKLDRLCEKQGKDDSAKDRNITKELEDLVQAQAIAVRAGAANEAMLYDDHEEGSQYAGGMHTGGGRSVSSRSSSEVRSATHEASVLSDAESKASTRGSDLLATVRSVIQAVEALAQATGSEHELSLFQSGQYDGAGPERQVYPFMQWKNVELGSKLQGLIATSNKFLQGETDLVEFLAKLTAVVNYLTNICSRNLDELEARVESQEAWPNTRGKEDEFGRVSSSKAAKMKRLGNVEEDPEKAKVGNGEITRCSEDANKEFEGMNGQQHEAGKSWSDGSNFNMECEVHEMSISKVGLDRDTLTLHNKVIVLEEELADERRQHQQMVAKYEEIQQNIHSGSAGSDSSAGSLMRKISEWGEPQIIHGSEFVAGEKQVLKEREIQSASEKLAECQRSIIDLGKQLKALSSPVDSFDVLSKSDTMSEMHTQEFHSVNYSSSDHNCTPSGYLGEDNSMPWSTVGGNSVPSSPFLDRRRSPPSHEALSNSWHP